MLPRFYFKQRKIMSKNKKETKVQAKVAAVKVDAEQEVKMKFSENKFYNDLKTPIYNKGEVYTVKGADMIQRWLKRGGEIVSGELEYPDHTPEVSEVVPVEEDKEIVPEEVEEQDI